jgi:hypothetical protein
VEPRRGGEELAVGESFSEAARGAHRAGRVRARRTDTDREEIEDADHGLESVDLGLS